MKYIETNSTDPYFNLAMEEYILRNKTEDDWIMLWQNDNTIVIGLNQNTEEEINREFVQEKKINVVRRGTGGGAVYHDLGNLNYSFITNIESKENLSIARFTEPVCRALKSLGVNAVTSGRNDLTIDGRKFSGVAQRLQGNRVLHHGTLLFDSDMTVLSNALHPDEEKFKSKSTKSVKSRVVNLKEYLPEMTLTDFWEALKRELLAEGTKTGVLTEEEYREINLLADEKYRTWEWNYGRSPTYSVRKKKHFTGGTADIKMMVEKGRITDIAFNGDFMAVTECTPAAEALKGVQLTEEAVREALEALNVEEMFGKITVEELTGLICG